MQAVLIVVHLIVVIALVAVVLLQRSEGGALGIGGGGGFLTGRGQANALTRATAVLAALFFVTSLGLSILAGLNRGQRSILEGGNPGSAPVQPAGPATPAAPAGTGFDLRKQIEGGRASPAAPAPPTAPEVPRSQ